MGWHRGLGVSGVVLFELPAWCVGHRWDEAPRLGEPAPPPWAPARPPASVSHHAMATSEATITAAVGVVGDRVAHQATAAAGERRRRAHPIVAVLVAAAVVATEPVTVAKTGALNTGGTRQLATQFPGPSATTAGTSARVWWRRPDLWCSGDVGDAAGIRGLRRQRHFPRIPRRDDRSTSICPRGRGSESSNWAATTTRVPTTCRARSGRAPTSPSPDRAPGARCANPVCRGRDN